MTEYKGVKVIGGAVVNTEGIMEGNLDLNRAEAVLRKQNPSVSLTSVHHVCRMYYMDFNDFYDIARYTEQRLD